MHASTRPLFKAYRDAYIYQLASKRITDLGRICAADEGGSLAEQRGAKNILWRSKVDVIQRIECLKAQREPETGVGCPAKARTPSAAEAAILGKILGICLEAEPVCNQLHYERFHRITCITPD